MARIVNTSKRPVFVGTTMLVPGKAVECSDVEALKRQYPDIAAMMERGEIQTSAPKNAQSSDAAKAKGYEDMTTEELVELAVEKGIAGAKSASRTSLIKALSRK